MEQIETPNVKTIDEVCDFLSIPASRTIKTLFVEGVANKKNNMTQTPTEVATNTAINPPIVAICLRGDHTLNELKIEKHPLVASPLVMASEEAVKEVAGCSPGSVGPVSLTIPVIIDRDAAVISDFVCGANFDGFHLKGVNWDRDAKAGEIFDCRNIVEGDISPDGQGTLTIKRGIEVGHIFQLGTKYSEAMKATVLDENGKSLVLTMGCYGIGVSRIVAAAIEQNFDEYGIVWPENIAPFQVAIIPMNMKKSERVAELATNIYTQLRNAGVEVLLDDRNERPGVMFADMELIGIPHRLVISDRGIEAGLLEYKHRNESDKQEIKVDDVFNFLLQVTAH